MHTYIYIHIYLEHYGISMEHYGMYIYIYTYIHIHIYIFIWKTMEETCGIYGNSWLFFREHMRKPGNEMEKYPCFSMEQI